jgi:hypothetical protein
MAFTRSTPSLSTTSMASVKNTHSRYVEPVAFRYSPEYDHLRAIMKRLAFHLGSNLEKVEVGPGWILPTDSHCRPKPAELGHEAICDAIGTPSSSLLIVKRTVSSSEPSRSTRRMAVVSHGTKASTSAPEAT